MSRDRATVLQPGAWLWSETLSQKKKKNTKITWVRWLMPVIPALREVRCTDHFRSGVRDQLGQDGETPSLLKI